MKQSSNKGGLLVGKTDRDDGEGIKVIAPEGQIVMGGGEVIINEEAAKLHCQELSRINQSTGGVAIPCDAQKSANKGPTDRMEDGGAVESNEAQVKELRDWVESSTDTKTTTKFNKTGSMRGYVTFTPKSKGGKFVDFPHDILATLKKQNPGTEKNPNFYRTSGVDIYIGNEVFNKAQNTCNTCKTEIPQTHHYCSSCKDKYTTEKFEEGKNEFLGYTTNLGRAKSLTTGKKLPGSGGWGYGENYEWSYKPLTKTNLDNNPQLRIVELKNKEKITREEAYKLAEELTKMDQGGALKEGIAIEKEHTNLYNELKNRLQAEGIDMPMTKTEFYTWIAKAHIDEKSDYYTLLKKYVESKNTGYMEDKKHDLKSNAVSFEHKNILGATTLSWVTTNDGRHFYKVFEGEKSHEDIYNFYKEKGIVVTHCIADVIHNTAQKRDLSALKNYIEKQVKEQFNSEINLESMMIPYTDHGDHGFTVQSFEFDLKDGSKVKYNAEDQTLTKLLKSGGKIDNSSIEAIESNGTKYYTQLFTAKGNDWQILFVWGNTNYVSVRKLTNNPFGALGKDFKNVDDAIAHYKTPEMKAQLIYAESQAKLKGYEPKMAEGGAVKSGLRHARVTFDNGHVINTSINGTDEEIQQYYKIGKEFNLGRGEHDSMANVTKVEIDPEDDKMAEGGKINRSYENGYRAIGTMNTADGEIEGYVRYNDLWKTYQVYIDGALYGEHDNLKDAIDELDRSRVKNITKIEPENKMANGGSVPKKSEIISRIKSELKKSAADENYDNDDVENELFAAGYLITGWDPQFNEKDNEYVLKATYPERLNFLLEKLSSHNKSMHGPGKTKNQYEGKSAQEIWDNWSEGQRTHFLADHFSNEDGPTRFGKTIDADNSVKLEYKNLAKVIQNELRNHVHEGQYDTGGKINDQYAGKTPQQIWTMWSPEQRRHFMADHYDDIFGISINEVKGKESENNQQSLQAWDKKAFSLIPKKVKTVLEEHVDMGQFAKGGKTKSSKVNSYASVIAGQTGLKTTSVESWLTENGLTNDDALKIATGIGRKQISGIDFSTAVLGNKDNEYSKKMVEFAKTNAAFKAETGGKIDEASLHKTKQKEYSQGGEVAIDKKIESPTLATGGKITDLCPTGTHIQSLIFSKDKFKRTVANEWLKEHGFKNRIDMTDNTFRARQRKPSNFKPTSFKTTDFDGKLPQGIQAVIGCLRSNVKNQK